MVRKWSYLDSNHFKVEASTFGSRISIYNFKVFRTTTRFKKYNRSLLTIAVRKKYARRKHRTNWLRLLMITKSWVTFYFRSRQFVRFYQSLKLFNTQSVSTNVRVFTRCITDVVGSTSLTTLSCSTVLINFFKQRSSSNNYINNPLSSERSTGLLTLNPESLLEAEPINPGLMVYDSLLYPYNTRPQVYQMSYQLYTQVNQLLFQAVLRKCVAYYKILTLLTLYRL